MRLSRRLWVSVIGCTLLCISIPASWYTTFYTGTWSWPEGRWSLRIVDQEGTPVEGAKADVRNSRGTLNYLLPERTKSDHDGILTMSNPERIKGGVSGWYLLWVLHVKDDPLEGLHIVITAPGGASAQVDPMKVIETSGTTVITVKSEK